MSCFDFWVPALLLGIAALLALGRFKERALAIVLLAAVGLTDGVFVNGLKHAANRPRPKQAEAVRVVDLQKARPRLMALFLPPAVKTSEPEPPPIRGRSFPSGHTADNFAAAAVIAFFYRRRGWLYFPVAALVGYSRIYTGAHWPSDVLFSAFLGTALGFLGAAAAGMAWKRWGNALSPEWRRRHPALTGTTL